MSTSPVQAPTPSSRNTCMCVYFCRSLEGLGLVPHVFYSTLCLGHPVLFCLLSLPSLMLPSLFSSVSTTCCHPVRTAQRCPWAGRLPWAASLPVQLFPTPCRCIHMAVLGTGTQKQQGTRENSTEKRKLGRSSSLQSKAWDILHVCRW